MLGPFPFFQFVVLGFFVVIYLLFYAYTFSRLQKHIYLFTEKHMLTHIQNYTHGDLNANHNNFLA